jgi:hypothetical protein
MPILAQAAQRPATREVVVGNRTAANVTDALRLLSWVGAAFVILGFTDIALAWYPVRFGNPDWEFAIIGGTMSALALPHLGMYLVLASAISRGQRGTTRAVGVAMVILLLTLLGLIFVTVVPLALNAIASNAPMLQGAKKAILKAILLGSGYSILLGFGAYAALRKRPEA